MKEKKAGRPAVTAFLFTTLNACALIIPMSYITYIFTDIGHVDAARASAGMSIANAVGLVFSLFTGMLIQKTKSKLGQFRPWILICGLLTVVGTFMTLIPTGNVAQTFVLITAGYCIAGISSDAQLTAQYGIFEKFSQGDSDQRNKIVAASMAGSNVGYTVFAALLIVLMGVFSGGEVNEEGAGNLAGFLGSETVIAVSVVLALLIMTIAGKRYDPDNRQAGTDDVGAVSVKDMLSALTGNPALIAIFIAELLKNTGYYAFTYLYVYQCTAVLWDFNLMALSITVQSIICAVASFCGPAAVKLFKGRKRACVAACLLLAASYCTLGFTGGTYMGFLIVFSVASFFEGIFMAISINTYLDAGEWSYDKTGKDTRAFVMSVQAIGGKIALIVSSIIFGIVLTSTGYDEMTGMFAEGGEVLFTRLDGFIPAAGALLYALIVIVFHHISDKEMEECIERNAEKDALLYGEMTE